MNNLKKRCLTLLLSLAMIVTYMPTSMIAYAVDGDPNLTEAGQQVETAEPTEAVAPQEEAPEEKPEDVTAPEEKTEDVKSEETGSEEKADDAKTEEVASEEKAKDAKTEEVASEEKAKDAKTEEVASDEKAKDEAATEEESSEEAVTPAGEEAEAAEEAKEEFREGKLSWNKGKYKVTVSYDADAKIPEGSTLKLTDYAEGSAEYEAAKKELLKDDLGNSPFSDFDENATDEELEGLGMAAFDLTIIDKDGNPIEPAPDAKVQVNVELVELPEGVDAQTLADSMEIQHLNEKSGEIVVEKVATVDSNEASQVEELGEIDVDTKDETASVEFTVDGFSTYTISWNYNWRDYSYSIHYVDTNGNSLTPTITPTFTNGSNFLIYDVDGYEYDSTHYGSRNGSSILPYISHYGDRYYTSGNNWSSLRDDVYVVYKKKATPPSGGTPEAPSFDDETWPNAPKFTKTSKNVGNGTNTISLTVNAPEKPVSKGAKADVIVVFDVSGSMDEDISDSDRTDRIVAAKKPSIQWLTNCLEQPEMM